MKLHSTVIVAWLLVGAGANHRINLKGDDFPQVYTAVVPKPGISETDPYSARFSAEVDLIGTAEMDDPQYVRLSFIVHNEKELEYLTGLATSPKRSQSQAMELQLDIPATSDLWDKASPRRDDDDSKQKDLGYSTISGFSCYRDLAGTEQFMSALVDQASSIPNLEVTMSDIGDSYLKTQDSSDGYDIWALKITGNGVSSQGHTTEKAVLFAMTGIHAREYAPPELGARWAQMLVDGYANDDAEIVSILDHTEIHLVLQANPDGRHVAETKPALYRRKNLNPSSGDAHVCGEGSYGVDLNRNFPFKWGSPGASSNPCEQTYRGTSAASEPEVQAIVNYVSSLYPEDQRKPNPEAQMNQPYPETAMGVFLDIHSAGEIIIWPWGHVNKETGNDSGMETLANKYIHFNGYDFAGPNNGYTYPASGVTDDWAYGSLGAAAMTFELGTEFYQNCNYFENQIVPKNLPALTYAAKVSKAPYSIGKGPDVTTLSLSSTSIPSNGQLTITASVSDSAWSPANFPTSQQTIQEVRVFLDQHPNDLDASGNAPVGTVLSGNYLNSGSGTATHTVSVAQLPSPLAGRHSVHVQATDSDGYKGPVTTASFQVTATSIDPDAATCVDDATKTFHVESIDEDHDCAWLAQNMGRFDYLCQLLDVAVPCKNTCQYCGVFA